MNFSFTVNEKINVDHVTEIKVWRLLRSIRTNDQSSYESLIHSSAIHDAIKCGYLIEEI